MEDAGYIAEWFY